MPSGTLWRRYNNGASSPTEFGLFYAWGDPIGHAEDSGYDFSAENYANSPASSISKNLEGSNDMATAYLGAPCRLPSLDDLTELVENCDSIWTTLNGVRGRLFTSRINGQVLFFPAAGDYNGTSLSGRGSIGRYWSSTHQATTYARSLYFNSSDVYPQYSYERRYGFSVRAVQGGTPNRSIVPPTPEDEPKEEETATVEEPKDSNER